MRGAYSGPMDLHDQQELDRIGRVDVHPRVHKVTEPDEEEVLRDLYGVPDSRGVFSYPGVDALTAAVVSGTPGALLTEARRMLGVSGRPNVITRDYAARHGGEFLQAAWCDMAVTYWARRTGNADSVLPRGDRAYTVWHAEDFRRLARWFAGIPSAVARAPVGAIVFFDWGQSDAINKIDHVGVVEKRLADGRVQTIEGNTGDAVRRRVRGAADIAGFGHPAYRVPGPTPPPPPVGTNWTEILVKKLPTLTRGATGEHVQSAQGLLQARSHHEVAIDGDFGPATETAVKEVQRWGGISEDGVIGKDTWSVLLRVK